VCECVEEVERRDLWRVGYKVEWYGNVSVNDESVSKK
jgi:hypothetical protein